MVAGAGSWLKFTAGMSGHAGAVERPAPLGIIFNGSSLAENSDVGATWGTLIANDPTGAPFVWTELADADGKFTVNASTGAVTLTAALDYETATSHAFSVRLMNRFGLTLDADLTGTVLDFDELNPAAPPVNTVAPSISGTTKVDHVLTVANGTWIGNAVPGFLYQWKRNTVAITNAVARTYTLTLADLGASITCTVTGRNQVTSTDATSAAVGPITASEFLVSRYIATSGAGTQTGNSWANAGPISKLDQFIGEAGPDGIVYVRADAGSYSTSPLKTITHGGTAGHPVTIRGVNVNLVPTLARHAGSRQDPWDDTGTGAQGSEVIRLQAGADHLSFEFLSFDKCGNGCFRVADNIADLNIESCSATNVRRFVESNISGAAISASITGFSFSNLDVRGFSKGGIRVRYDSSDGVVEDCFFDGENQDGDNFCVGVDFSGTAHDIDFNRVISMRCISTNILGVPNPPGDYWNGDCFKGETGNYNFAYTDCEAYGSTDGGYDIKGGPHTYLRCRSGDNKKNWRLWGGVYTLTECFGYDSYLRGGNSRSSHIWLSDDNGTVTVTDSAFTQLDSSVAFDFDNAAPGCTFTTVNTSVQGTDTDGNPVGAAVTLDPKTAPPNTVLPLITGTTTAGSTLSVSDGTWPGAVSYTYQWKRNGRFIALATTRAYVLTSADIGQAITCTVYAKTGAGYVGEVTSLAAGAVAGVAPTISGSFIAGLPRVGATLRITLGTITGSPTPSVSYRWRRDGSSFGVTDPTYTLLSTDLGKTITCDVTVTSTSGTDTEVTAGVVVTAALAGELYIGPARAGLGDGSSWANQGSIYDLNSFIAGALPNSNIYIANDQGNYVSPSLTINHGGSGSATDTAPSTANFVNILGVNASLVPGVATITGTRTVWANYAAYLLNSELVTSVSSWSAGNTAFHLTTGANYLTFSKLRFENVGMCFNLDPDSATDRMDHIHVTDCEFLNVQRFQEMAHVADDTAGYPIGYCLFKDITGIGHSKSCLRARGSAHDWLFQNIDIDSGRQDRDNFAVGIKFDDLAVNCEIIDCTSINTHDTTSSYWNGDGGSGENFNKNIYWENFTSRGHTDAGIDSKQDFDTADWISGGTTGTYRLRADHPYPIVGGTFGDSKKGLKIWSGLSIKDATFEGTRQRGGTSGPSQMDVQDPRKAAHITVVDGTFSGAGAIAELNHSSSTLVLDGCVLNNPAGTTIRGGTAADPHLKLVDCTGTYMDALRAAKPDYTTPKYRTVAWHNSDGSAAKPSFPGHKEDDIVLVMAYGDYTGTVEAPRIVDAFGETWNIETQLATGSFASYLAWRRMDWIQYGSIETYVGVFGQTGSCHSAVAASFGGCVASGTPYEDYESVASSTSSATTATGNDRTVINWHACSNNDAFGSTPAGFTLATSTSTSIGGDTSSALLVKEDVDTATSAATALSGGGTPTITHSMALIPV